MARLRFNGVKTTLGGSGLGSDPESDTTITFASKLVSLDGDVPTIADGDYLVLRVDDELVHLVDYTSGATTGTITRGEEGTTVAAHSAPTPVVHTPTVEDFRAQAVIDSRVLNATNISASTADTQIVDLSVPAQEGDWISVTLSGLWSDNSSQPGRIDGSTRVDGSDVTWLSSRTSTRASGGVQGWEAATGAVNQSVSGTVFYQLGEGDIDDGEVVVRLVCWLPAGGSRTLRADSGRPLYAALQNLGPAPF